MDQEPTVGPIREECIIDDSGNPIIFRFTGDVGKTYEFMYLNLEFRLDRMKQKFKSNGQFRR